MPAIGTVIKGLLSKVGCDVTKDEFKAVIALTDDIPQPEADLLEKNLLTAQSAESNPDIIGKVRATIFNGMDTRIADLLAENQLEADDDFKNEKSTFEKMAKLTKLAKAAGEKGAAAKSGSKTKLEWEAAEADYNLQLKNLKEGAAKKDTEFAETRKKDLTAFELKTILLGKEYSFPKQMAKNLQISTALQAVTAELTKKGLSINLNDAGELVILNKEGRPAFSDTNVALEPNTFIDGVLAQNNILKIQDDNDGAGGEGGGTGKSGEVIIPKGAVGNSEIANEIQQQLASMG